MHTLTRSFSVDGVKCLNVGHRYMLQYTWHELQTQNEARNYYHYSKYNIYKNKLPVT